MNNINQTSQMGCVDGAAIVHVNRARKGFQCTVAELFRKFHGEQDRGHGWDLSIPTHIRSLCGDTLRLNRVIKVQSKGRKPVVKLVLRSGKSVRLTPDHKVCTGYSSFCRADELKRGDTVLTNGTWIDDDGYVRVGGLKGKHPRYTTGGVYEHILVAERMLRCPLADGERVHHKNGIRHDNRPENLEVLTHAEHARLHGKEGGFAHLHGGRGRVCFVPTFDTVISVKQDGQAEVYDVVCAGPHRNFVANGVIVHNCTIILPAETGIEKSRFPHWRRIGPTSFVPSTGRLPPKWGVQLPADDPMVRSSSTFYDCAV